jgi:hypothetical protein
MEQSFVHAVAAGHGVSGDVHQARAGERGGNDASVKVIHRQLVYPGAAARRAGGYAIGIGFADLLGG